MSGLDRVCLWVSDFTVVFSSVYVQVYAIISHGQRCSFMFRIFFYLSFHFLARYHPRSNLRFFYLLRAHSRYLYQMCCITLFFSSVPFHTLYFFSQCTLFFLYVTHDTYLKYMYFFWDI